MCDNWECSIGLTIIKPENTEKVNGSGLTFCGEYKHVWVEVKCNRPERHDVVGEHSYTGPYYRINWQIGGDSVWIGEPTK